MKKHIKHHSITVAVVLGVLAIGAGAFVYSGLYNIGADDHHTKPVFAVMQTLREQSIHARSKDIVVPDLNDEQLILKGAGQYAAMCTQCHLKPGMKDSELRSEEHTSELQSLMRISYAVFCLKKKTKQNKTTHEHRTKKEKI